MEQASNAGEAQSYASKLAGAALPASIPSPKLSRSQRSLAYRYYAGFSESFVRDLLAASKLSQSDSVVDVWNGSGTTTRVAASVGVPAVGLDINPVMTFVARARLLSTAELKAVSQGLARLIARGEQRVAVNDDDPLLAWFDRGTAGLLRSIQGRFSKVSMFRAEGHSALAADVLQAHFYTSLFIVVRRLLRQYIGSNPTWVKLGKVDEDRVTATWDEVRLLLLEASTVLCGDALSRRGTSKVDIKEGSSLEPSSRIKRASLALTSPPYCTRIDYAVATRPELAVLGMTLDAQRVLRQRMLGTTTVPGGLNFAGQGLGLTGSLLLRAVTSHSAKASATYYSKWLAQYLRDYSISLKKLGECMADESTIVLVTQDSYYKDLRIDLPQISIELMQANGWSIEHSYDFSIPTTMAGVNRETHKYRHDFSACERVLIFNRC